ncbi:MAG: galactokinase [Lachnospiraceae bacterium]|jgi:galactokinase
MYEFMAEIFEKVYGDRNGIRVFFAPGRVNLIGEHTDYNGGHVFPCALTLGTYAAVRKRDDNIIRMYSENIPEGLVVERELGDYTIYCKNSWSNYPFGVIWALDKQGKKLTCGYDIVYYGNIPGGAGLSSSASIEVLTAYMFNELCGWDISLVDISILCQYSENNYNGMNCGIMDQFASAMGKENYAIFLDTATLEYEYAPIELDDKIILIINSNVKHSLSSSKYNERRSESEAALLALKAKLDIETLGDLDEETFNESMDLIKNPIERKRAKHAVYENRRTIKAYNALKSGDIEEFGKLMVESHLSLRDDYEVSCKEIDCIVDLGIHCDGVYGIRITGGGFGGCCVSIVDADKADAVISYIGSKYKEAVGYGADFYTVKAGSGPCEVKG